MTGRKWILVGLGSLGGVWLGNWLAHRSNVLTVAPATGPGFWDGLSIWMGIVLGVLLRLAFKRQIVDARQGVVAFAGLMLILALTFLPWPPNSPVRSLVLPCLELLVVAWAVAGSSPERLR